MRARDYETWLRNFGVICGALFLGALVLGGFGWFGRTTTCTLSSKAKSECHSLSNAIRYFRREYGYYPVPAAHVTGGDVFASADDLQAVICHILQNDVQAGAYVAELNWRSIPFMEAPNARPIDGAPKGGIASNGRYYDPWGREYRILIDTNEDGRLANPYQAHAGAGSISAPAIAWSLGIDRSGATDRTGAGDKKRGANRDDILSWQ